MGTHGARRAACRSFSIPTARWRRPTSSTSRARPTGSSTPACWPARVRTRSCCAEPTATSRFDARTWRTCARWDAPPCRRASSPSAPRDCATCLAYLAGGYEGFRVLDLRLVCNASTRRSMYDPVREDRPMRFAHSRSGRRRRRAIRAARPRALRAQRESCSRAACATTGIRSGSCPSEDRDPRRFRARARTRVGRHRRLGTPDQEGARAHRALDLALRRTARAR